jgi:SAM-dependent methyltransferase
MSGQATPPRPVGGDRHYWLSFLLDLPAAYQAIQGVFVPGEGGFLDNRIRRLLDGLPPGARILDVGCGPSSRLWDYGYRPVGLDTSARYLKTFRRDRGHGIAGSAGHLPFKDGTFAAVWSFGLLHHLDGPNVVRAIAEMVRVARLGGAVVVFDAVMPRSGWRRPLVWPLRRFDRGGNVRTQEAMEALLVERQLWRCERFTYSWIGHEGVFGVYRKDGALLDPGMHAGE